MSFKLRKREKPVPKPYSCGDKRENRSPTDGVLRSCMSPPPSGLILLEGVTIFETNVMVSERGDGLIHHF